MDTDCLQEEISVTPERTPVATPRRVLPCLEIRDAGGLQHSALHVNGMGGSKGEGGVASPASRIEAAKRSLERAVNGDSAGRSTKGEKEGDISAASAVKVLRDSGLTSSPSGSFKSSYAKSIADSYRRASIPVVISSPKGQFYFKNEEFLSLSKRPVTDISHEKFHSLSMNGDSRASLAQKPEPLSLPPIIDSQEQKKLQETEKIKEKLVSSSPGSIVYERLLGKDVFVPLDQLHRIWEELDGSLTHEDWSTLSCISTSDGRKLVKLSDIKVLLRQQEQQGSTQNGHALVGGSEKVSQVESLQVERAQLDHRVDQLCRALADRDSTVQRLEEDLLRIRMECQRLMMDNRSLKSNVGQKANQTQPPGTDSPSQASHLHQQVHLLTAQLNKAEQSRHTYEAATRQLVDFLHTVNSTLNSASHIYTNSPATSPTCSLHSSASTTTTKTSSSTPAEADDDPPYRPGRPSTPPPVFTAAHSTLRAAKSSAEAMKKAGSVWALPTQTLQPRKVSRAVSTHCVASAASSFHSEPTAGAAASPGSERTRPHTTDFLATRARELLASLKSLMRSDRVWEDLWRLGALRCLGALRSLGGTSGDEGPLGAWVDPSEIGGPSCIWGYLRRLELPQEIGCPQKIGASSGDWEPLRKLEAPEIVGPSGSPREWGPPKSLVRVLKLNLEPKKSGSSGTSGRNRNSSRSAKVEITPIVPLADTEPPTKTSAVIENPQNTEGEGSRRPTTLSLPSGDGGREKSYMVSNETSASPTISKNLNDTSTATAPAPKIGTGKTREDTLLPQSSVLNGNPQPLSLMVVGDHPCTPGDNRYSSLPMRTHLARTLTDADQRLVWV
ncbi:hypothetical protein GWK47_013999 [Chionoecetes opilio]|uniref:Uncharacterized protein n=1 Tax=Chionoecetes opilio TaxID=41210 RepID=A0A8J5CNM6_CHIOP|nr:hypothetical protein GWK47_013999 [Chionoecetes opilio]